MSWRFTAVSPTSTLVELRHRDLDRLGEHAPMIRPLMDQGWASILESFAEVAKR